MIVENNSGENDFFGSVQVPATEAPAAPPVMETAQPMGIGEVQEEIEAPPRKERFNNDSSDFFGDVSGEIQRIQAGNLLAKDIPPEKAARILNLQENTGFLGSFIQDNLEILEKEQISAGFEPNSFREANPKLAGWMASNPYNHSLIKEDLGFFASIENNAKAFYQGAAAIPGQNEFGDLSYKRFKFGLTPEEEVRRNTLKKEMEDQQWPRQNDTTSSWTARQFGDSLGQLASSTITGAKGAAKGMVAGGAITLLGGPVTVGAGAVAGSATELFLNTYQKEAGFAFNDLENFKDVNGKPLDRETAKTVAEGVGLINGVIEMGSNAVLAKLIPGAKGFIEGLTKGQLNSAIKVALSNPVTKTAIVGALKKITAGGFTEGAEEFMQAMVGSGGREVAQSLSGQTFAPDSLKEDVKGALSQGGSATVGTILTGGLFASSARFYSKMQQVKQAKQDQNFYLALGEGVENSKTFKSLPQKGQEAVAEILKDGPFETAHIDTETFQTFFQSKGMDPREVATELFDGDATVYDQAIESGHALPIPMAKYARKIGSNAEFSKFFAREIRRDPMAMNFRESEEVLKQLEDMDQQILESGLKNQEDQVRANELRTEAELVGNEFSEKLSAAGINERATKANVDLVKRTFAQLGLDSNQTAKELADQYEYTITKKENESGGGEGEFFQSQESKTPTVKVSPLGFYSQVESEVFKMEFKSIPGQDLVNRLKKTSGIKEEEVEHLGLYDFLQTKEGKVTKEEVLNFIQQNGVQVEQIVLAEEFGDEDSDTKGVADLEWNDGEREDADSDEIQSEADYYLEEKEEYFKDEIAELKAELSEQYTDEDGEVNEVELDEEIDKRLSDMAWDRASESLNSDDYHNARYTYTEEVTGWTLEGNNEQGWWSSEARESFEADIEEAKIQLVAHMIAKGAIDGDIASLVQAKDIAWREPKGLEHQVTNKTIETKAKALIKSDKERFEKLAEEEYAGENWHTEDTPKEKADTLKDYTLNHAREAVMASYRDVENAKNIVTFKINNPILEGEITGNNKNGYSFTYEMGKKKEAALALTSKTPDEAKAEAIKYLEDKGVIGKAIVRDENGKININAPTGKARYEKYSVDGAENYREFLLTLPHLGGEDFTHGHFSQKNFVVHARVSDRVDNEGKKVLFLEELQSDWHQQGRERGYKNKAKIENINFSTWMKKKDPNISDENIKKMFEEKDSDEYLAYREEQDQIMKDLNAVPDAPFKNTETWAALAFKRMVNLAVEEGYDKVAWTGSDVHVERWGTDSIGWKKIDRWALKKEDGSTFTSDKFKTEEIAREEAAKYPGKYEVVREVFYLVGAVEQRGGRAGGVNIEELARQRGELLERNGEKVATKEELSKVIGETLNRERNDRSLDSLTESVWKKMQEEETGAKFPRKEGMEFFYDNLIPKKVAPAVLKKLDPLVKVEETVIQTEELRRPAKIYSEENTQKIEGINSEIEKTRQELIKTVNEIDATFELKLDQIESQREKINKQVMDLYKLQADVAEDDTKSSEEIQGKIRKLNKEDDGARDKYSSLRSKRREAVAKAEQPFDEKISKLEGEIQNIPAIGERTHETMTVKSFALTDKLKEAVAKGQTLFQKKTEEPASGSIQIGGRSFDISLFAGMDRSTFLHEMGHSYLKIMSDLVASGKANERLQNNFKAALTWLGVESADQIQREHHEKWARGYEAYILRGEAPSVEMKGLFRKFSKWLKKIYRDIQGMEAKFGFKLSPDIVEVFDKMMASDEEIAQAKASQNNQGLIDAMSASGFKPELIKEVNDLEVLSRERAEEELTQKVMADLSRQREAWWRYKSAEIREVIEGEVNQRRDYFALSVLEKGVLPNGNPLPEGMPRLKLSREDLFKNYKIPKQNIYAAEGQNVEVAASLFGFKSGQEMLNAFAVAEDKDAFIDRTVYEEMKKEYGDMLDDGEIREEAEKKVRSEMNSQVNHRILEILATENYKELKQLGQKVSTRIPGIEAIRARAEEVIAGKVIGDIRPKLYLQAARKARQQTIRALTEINIQEAFAAHYRSTLSEEMYRAAEEARESVDKTLARYKKVFKSDEVLAKTREMNLINAARAVLSKYGIGKMDKTPEEYLKQFVDYGEDLDQVETITEYVTSATQGAAPYKLVDYNKFLEMAAAVDALLELSKTTKEIEVDGKKESRDAAIGALSARIFQLSGNDRPMGVNQAVTDAEERKVNLLGAVSALRRVRSWVDAMDGGDSRGIFRRYIFNPVKDATLNFREAKSNQIREYLEIVKSVEKSLTFKDIEAPEINYTFKGKGELLGALLHTGNESNQEKLLIGRGWGELNEDRELVGSRWSAFIDRAQAEGILTKADFDFAQAVWDLNEKIKPQAQQAHKRMYGRYFNEVTAKEFDTSFGKYRGGYVPAIADPFLSEDSAIRNEKERILKQNNSFMFPTTGRGFTKGRVENYHAPIALDLKYVPAHIDKVMRFIHMEPAIKDVSRIVMNKQFRAVLKSYDPTLATDMLVPWLQISAQQMTSTPSTSRAGKALDKFFRTVRTNTGINIMAGNVTNSLQQLTGLSIAAVKVKPRYLRNALWNYVRGPKKMAEQIIEKSPSMKERMTGNTFETMKHIDDILLNPDKYEQARDFARKHGYFLQSAMQNVVDVVVWTGAYNQAVENNLSEKEAIREADGAVESTQGSSSPEEVSRFQTGSDFVSAFTMFSGYFNMLGNLLGTETLKVVRDMGLRKGAGRAFYIYAFGFMIPAVLNELLIRTMSGKGLDEDDDDKYMDDIMDIFFGSQLRTATALIPLVGPVLTAGVNRWNDKYYDDRISTSPIISMIESTVAAPESVYQAIMNGGSSKKAVRDTLTAIGLISGLPVAPLSKPIGYGIDVMEGKADPTGPIDFTRGLVTGKAGDN